MSNKFVVWILVALVILIWGNMIRVSLPVIIESLSVDNVEQGYSSTLQFQPPVRNKEVNYNTMEPLRNPFERRGRVVKSVKNLGSANKEVYSLFSFRGSFSIDGKKVAILEGRADLGVSGLFYVSEGESVMNEKVVEIGENYVIILKDGVMLTLYEAR